MARKRKVEHANHERWLVSYADFITLLFAFFVVLYASSASDKNKMNSLAQAIETAFQQMGVLPGQTLGPPLDTASGTAGAPLADAHAANGRGAMIRDLPSARSDTETGPPIDFLKIELEKLLAEEIRRRSISLRVGPDGLVISLRELAFYPSGSAEIRPEALPTIERIAALLRSKQCMLRVEGHTDNVPIHTPRFNSNWELSTSRATELVKLMIDRFEFPPRNLSAAGFGEFHPITANDTPENRSLNRRIDVIILSRGKPTSLDKDIATRSR